MTHRHQSIFKIKLKTLPDHDRVNSAQEHQNQAIRQRLRPNNKVLALTRATSSNSGSAIFEVCEILDDGTTKHGLKVGRYFSYEDSKIARFIAPLAFLRQAARN
jgi:hypothetical protein